MKPLAQFSPAKKIAALFADFDGTLTEGQSLPWETVRALGALQRSGIFVGIVSGRPAGWGECLSRILPIDCFIFENGAGYYYREANQVTRVDLVASQNQLPTLKGYFSQMEQRFGPLLCASDQPFRLFDYTIDVCEQTQPPIPMEKAREIVNALRTFPGVSAKLSSIHINYWVGNHDKLTALKKIMKQLPPLQKIALDTVVFVGDSPNDEPIFSWVEHSIGVANICSFEKDLSHPPQYVTPREESKGFVELVERILALQQVK